MQPHGHVVLGAPMHEFGLPAYLLWHLRGNLGLLQVRWFAAERLF
jgi:hypothetical protein